MDSLKRRAAEWSRRTADKSWSLYDRLILRRPKLSLLVLGVLCAIASVGIKDFRVDASGDTLVLEHDEDVRYYRGMSARYESNDFVIITWY